MNMCIIFNIYYKIIIIYMYIYIMYIYIYNIIYMYIYIMMINNYIMQTSLFKTCYWVLKCCFDIDFQIVCIRHSVHKIVNENVIKVTTGNIVVSPTGIVHMSSLSCKMDTKSKTYFYL